MIKFSVWNAFLKIYLYLYLYILCIIYMQLFYRCQQFSSYSKTFSVQDYRNEISMITDDTLRRIQDGT